MMSPLSASGDSIMTRNNLALLWIGSALLGICLIALRLTADSFAYQVPWLERPTITAVTMMMTAGAGYLLIIWAFHRGLMHRLLLPGLLLAGLLLRLMWLGSEPIYEDDSYRYFFDGAMVANGLNPYDHTPADALPNELFSLADELIEAEETPVDPTFVILQGIAETGPVDRVAYPYVKTIYPPVSQAFFALHHMLAAWSLDAWRLILLLVDMVSLVLLAKLARVYGKPTWGTLIFWLNPLVITETMNAGHMDALLIPFLVGTALLVHHQKYGWAGVALAGAVGVKLWPVLLAPLVFARLLKSPGRLIAAVVPFVVLSGLLVLPQVIAKLDATSGLAAYAEFWQVNAFLFSLLEQLLATVSDESGLLARLLVAGFVGLLVIKLSWRSLQADTRSLAESCLLVTAALYLLSPTGYPWYFIWLIPWLVVRPSPALLLLTVLLPLYDLRYPLSLDGDQNLFDTVIVPLQFLPILLLLTLPLMRLKRSGMKA